MPSHAKRWQVAPQAPPSHIARFSHLHPLIVQVLYNRGITDPADVAAFLGSTGGEASPFALEGISEAVTRLRHALRAEEPIAVYGDFDADGVTATVLLVQTLQALGGSVRHYIPHRVDEGYGLHKAALAQLAREGTRVVVTVDCGVRSADEVAYARRLGLDVIVTDHHSIGPQLPEAVAVIDPKRPDCPYPCELAGVGVAYRLAQALLHSHRQTPVTAQEVRLEEDDLLDLVALGTVADLAPLLGENRTLVQRGLASINRMERPGVEALCRQAGLKPGQVDATSIGFALGPRLNAAGRLTHAQEAYQLLETAYPSEAERLAAELDHLNRERQQLTLETHERARRLALDAGDEETPFLFAAAPDFQAGIVGLVASRLVDEFYRPAVVVEVGKKYSKGSARSIPEFHITAALDECADLLFHHGGHAAAAGFTVLSEHLGELERRLRRLAAEQLAGVELAPVLAVDAAVELAQMSGALHRELNVLEPCGYANPHPLFLSQNVRLLGQRAVGSDGKHLKLTLSDGQAVWDGIAFRQGEWAGKLPDRVDVVYHLEANEWDGQQRLQLNVQDVRPAGLDSAVARLWLGREGQE
jgi:single-stranded-DNA-specific exonuclease